MARWPGNQLTCPGFRVERDFLGSLEVPEEALYGIQTARALGNFRIGGDRLRDQPAFVVALAQVKAAAAQANRDLGELEPRTAAAIVEAAREVANGRLLDHFPLEIVQGGGGTATHMNVNEVLANRANQILGGSLGSYAPVNPYDHVNRSQSTNDVLPTAMGVAVSATSQETCTGLDHLKERLLEQAEAHKGLDRLGRTCLQDALPVPVSAVHVSQAHAVAQALSDLEAAVHGVLAVPLGATAVGTGFGAPEGFRDLAIRYLRQETCMDIRPAEDLFTALASLEQFVTVADAMAAAARVSARVAADLRLLASGPLGGIGEVTLPPLQAGSSIMPGKVNPVLPELVMQVSYQLAGAALAVHLAAGAGELELAVMGPVVTDELLRGLQRLGRVVALFADLCVRGLSWDRERIEANLRGSLQGPVESFQLLGYEEAVLPDEAD